MMQVSRLECFSQTPSGHWPLISLNYENLVHTSILIPLTEEYLQQYLLQFPQIGTQGRHIYNIVA